MKKLLWAIAVILPMVFNSCKNEDKELPDYQYLMQGGWKITEIDGINVSEKNINYLFENKSIGFYNYPYEGWEKTGRLTFIPMDCFKVNYEHDAGSHVFYLTVNSVNDKTCTLTLHYDEFPDAESEKHTLKGEKLKAVEN